MTGSNEALQLTESSTSGDTVKHAKFPNTFQHHWGKSAVKFKEDFRCNHDTMLKINELLEPHYTQGHQALPSLERTLIGVWFHANSSCYRELADVMGISKCAAHVATDDVINTLVKIAPRIIKFPTTEEEYERLSRSFQMKAGFPGVIGALDGSHIRLTNTPSEDYINRKTTPSVILQATCDTELNFTSVYCGWPGRVHDSRVCKNSQLPGVLSQIPEQYHLLGDAAYGLSCSMLTPYKGTNLDPRKSRYNYTQSHTRIAIERSFGLLKCRWRRLKSVDCKVAKASLITVASCVLHNICLMAGDLIEYELDPDNHAVYEGAQDRRDGAAKRERIADHLTG